jgi:hypothetical protein
MQWPLRGFAVERGAKKTPLWRNLALFGRPLALLGAEKEGLRSGPLVGHVSLVVDFDQS